MKSSISSQRTAFGQQLHDDLLALPTATRLSGEQLEVIYALAYAHIVQGQYAQALPIFSILGMYGPTRRHYLAGLALCLEKCERHEEALQIYSLLTVLFPEALEAPLQAAECLLALGRFAESAGTLDGILKNIQESGHGQELRPRAELMRKLAEQQVHRL